MRLQNLAACFFCLFLTVAPSAVQADDATRSAEDIRQCSRANFPIETAVQKFHMRSLDSLGSERTSEGKLSWRRSEAGLADINICFSAPSKLSGSCYLVEERPDNDEIFVYLPALNRVKRVIGSASSQTLLGSDISYEDLKQLQGVAAGGSLTRLEDAKLNEVSVYALEGRPSPERESPYTRVVSYVDKTTCVPLQVDFYQVGDVHKKRLSVERETLTKIGGRWQVRNLLLSDLQSSSSTQIKFEEGEYDEGIASRVFNKRSFYMLN